MKFSENWLRELVTIDADRASLVHALTMSGLEVEEVTPLGEELDGVVVAEIVEAVKHPEADRLQVCKVDAGQGELLQIVCGAPNARVGIRVPLAMVGATLPGDDPDQGGQAAWRRVVRHALFGQGTRHRRRRLRVCSNCRPTRPSASRWPSTWACPMPASS